MAHKTLIGGTAYEIKGGRTLVNGTGYEIKKGRTLVGGTGYDLSFSNDVTVTFNLVGQGMGHYTAHYMIINGVKYSSQNRVDTSVVVQPGSIITFCVIAGTDPFTEAFDPGTVEVNGKVVFSNRSDEEPKTYDWTVPDGISQVNIKPWSMMAGAHFYITTS